VFCNAPQAILMQKTFHANDDDALEIYVGFDTLSTKYSFHSSVKDTRWSVIVHARHVAMFLVVLLGQSGHKTF
jgi:hypothetical protein